MKEMTLKILAVLTVCLTLMCFSACGGNSNEPEISADTAESLIETYLRGKGFGEEDFLSESNIMVIDEENVYVFSWRTKVGENADKLLGMYAVSFDGKSFYEYQEARGEWIKDMNAE